MKIEVTLTNESLELLAEKVSKINGSVAKQHVPATDKLFFTTQEAAEILKVSKQTIQNHIAKGLLKASKPGKSYIISLKQLEEYVNSNN